MSRKNSLGIDPDEEDGCESLNIVTCEDADLMAELLDLQNCPICGAEYDITGWCDHRKTGTH